MMAGWAFAIAIGVWWNANTISHLFIHRPFFRRRAANAAFAVALTALSGIPQSLWCDRHLAHHRGVAFRFRGSREAMLQCALVAGIWLLLLMRSPDFFLSAYVPGYVAGLMLCAVHGHYEHAFGTTSHYGRLYNVLCFNDGYHLEHHRHPSARWSTLPRYREPDSRASRWPAPLRWAEGRIGCVLVLLERIVLHSRLLQRFVVLAHERAFRSLLGSEAPPREIAIVGGGLFPRTALAMRAIFPDARITIVDASARNLDRAREFLQHDSAVNYVCSRFANRQSATRNQHSAICNLQCDVAVFPLSFDGDRSAIYRRPPAPVAIVHDWIWRQRGRSRIVSPLLLKRVNLITR